MCQARPSNPNREARLSVCKRETEKRVKRCSPKPDVLKLGDLPAKLEEGYISVPQFQRQFVWGIDDCAKLLDSVFKGYPLGTVTLWQTHERLRQVKKIAGHVFPQAKEGYPVNYVLDGQQRLTSIYACLKGERIFNGVAEVDYGKVFLKLDAIDGDDEWVTSEEPGSPADTYISIAELFDPNYPMLQEKYGPALFKTVCKCSEVLKTYPIPTIELTGASLLEATDIFTRINTTGKRLSVFEVMSARVYRETPHFDLIEKRDEQKEKWRKAGFETLPDYVTLQAMALCLHKSCTKDAVLSLTPNEVAGKWSKIDKAFTEAIDYLRTVFGIPAADLLPYDVLIIPFVYFMFKNKGKKPTSSQTKWLKDYFWRTALTQRFSNAVASKLTTDVAFFDTVLKDKTPNKSHLPLVSITPKRIAAEGTFKTGSSFIKAILCLFAKCRPLSLRTNAPVLIDNSWVSKKNAKNYHHFFPRAYMKGVGTGESLREVDHIANIIIIDSADNQYIKKDAPSKYVGRFRQDNPDLDAALKSHLIDDAKAFGICKDNYQKFFDRRVSRICEELTKNIVRRDEDELMA